MKLRSSWMRRNPVRNYPDASWRPHEKTKSRDVAILTLLLGTGIRVSECVGLNLEDVDFNNGAIRIIRKGGNEALIYFGDEVSQALEAYMNGSRKSWRRSSRRSMQPKKKPPLPE